MSGRAWQIPWLLSAVFLCLSGVASAGDRPHQLPIGDPDRRDKLVHLELDTILDTRSGEVVAPRELVAKLESTRLLLVGESHTSDEFHRVQETVLRALQGAGRTVVIGLEMLPTDVQPVLDRWSAGELDEETFLEEAGWYEHWGYHWEYYRPIFQLARRHGLSVRGLNVPRGLVRSAREKGFDELEPDDRERLPPEIQAPTDEFRRLFLSYFDDDSGMHGFEGDVLEGFLRSQTAWDASMGFAAAKVLEEPELKADPKAIVVVLVGSGHVAYGLGIARQAAPLVDGKISTLIPVAVDLYGDDDAAGAEVEGAEANDPEVDGVVADGAEAEPLAGSSEADGSELDSSEVDSSEVGRDEEADSPDHGLLTATVSASYADFVWGVAEERWPRFPSLGLSTRAGDDGTRSVLFVAEGGAAEQAGIEAGDQLLSIDGLALEEASTIRRVMAQKQWGDTVELRWRRGETEHSAIAYLRRTP